MRANPMLRQRSRSAGIIKYYVLTRKSDAEISRCSCNELLVHLPVCRTV